MNKFFLGASLTLAMTAAVASGQLYTLEDRNSSVDFDLGASGAYTWDVDGTDQLFQQWFWYRTGSMTSEQSIDALPLIGSAATDTNPFIDNRVDTLSALYGSLTGLNIEVAFRLQGGNAGSGASDLAEQIKISNNGTAPLTISFFQYSDFDLNGTAGGDTLTRLAPNGWTQVDDVRFQETVVTPIPTAWQGDSFPNLVNSLNDGGITNLNNTGANLAGDVTWAFQWDLTIGAGRSITISKDKNFRLIPAPGAFLLGAMGLAMSGWARRRLA